MTTTDLTYYERVACCILSTAKAVLEDHGLPIPARAEIADTGALGNPACCDALLVTRGKSKRNTAVSATNCGPQDKIVEWELRIVRTACQHQPECGTETETNCFDLDGWCPGDPFPVEHLDDACNTAGREWSRRLRAADRALLESDYFAAEIDHCLCAPELFQCDTVCDLSCSKPTEWYETEHMTGGGCAGSKIKIRTHTLGAN